MSNSQPYDDKNPLSRLTPELMEGYAKGTLSPDLMKKVEEFLEENPFEAAAVEGLRGHPVDLSSEMSELEDRLSRRTAAQPGSSFRYYWAAAISILLISALAIYLLVPSETENSSLATKQETITPGENVPVEPMPQLQEEGIPREQLSTPTENLNKPKNQPTESTEKQVIDERLDIAPENEPAITETAAADTPEEEAESAVAVTPTEPALKNFTKADQGVNQRSSPENIQKPVREKQIAFNNKITSENPAAAGQGLRDELTPAQAPERWDDYLSENLKYPDQASTAGIKGSVKIAFQVNIDGRPEQFQVIQKLGYGCDQEALRILENGPLWKPATTNGVPVVSMAEIEIKFPHH